MQTTFFRVALVASLVVMTVAVAAAQTRIPGSQTQAREPGLPSDNEAQATEAVETRSSRASAMAREVLLAVTWPEDLPRPGPDDPDRTRTLRISEGWTGTISFSVTPRDSVEYGIRPSVVDEAQGLVRVDILTAHLGQEPTPHFSVDESFELVVGGEPVVSTRAGFTFAATEIRRTAGGREADAPPARATRRPPGDTVQSPLPGSPTLAARPGPPDPDAARASASPAPPAGRPMAIALRIGLPDGASEPVLTLAAGTTGTLRLIDESVFGFKPTRLYPTRSRPGGRPVLSDTVRVEILDLSTSPWTSLGVVDVSGGESVRSPTSPSFTIRLSIRPAATAVERGAASGQTPV